VYNMKLAANLLVNRFEWAREMVNDIIKQYHYQTKAVYYDVGAGQNSLVKEFEKETGFSRSFDLLPFDTNIEQWDIENKFPYNYPAADIITFLEVVEHLNNPWLCIKNIADMMNTDGFLILTTPNPGWSTSRINLLTKGFLTCFTPSDLDLNHHVFTAWPHILEKLLISNGFEIVKYVTLDGHTNLFDKGLKTSSVLVQMPARIIKKTIEKSDPTSIGMSYGIIARKIGKNA